MTDVPAERSLQPRMQWLSAPAMMLVLGFSGMMIGLTIDLRSILPETLVAVCAQSHSFRDSLVLHATLLPATNMLMFASGIAAACFSAWPLCQRHRQWRERYAPLLPYVGCTLAMLAGMSLSEWLAPQLARSIGWSWSLSAMVTAMVIGMGCGMLVWIPIASFAARTGRVKPLAP
jgi:hypothetical protein